jgi:hypothetical protein
VTRRPVVLFLALIAFASLALARGGTQPLTADFWAVSGTGVNGDGQGPYANSKSAKVSCYFSSNGSGLVLTTYNSGRVLKFAFDTSSPAWQASGLPADFGAEVNLNGINFYGKFVSMDVGSTAQLQTDLRFHYAGSTWDLHYPGLAVQRRSESQWLITSNAIDLDPYWNPSFLSDAATLSVQRKRTNTTYGVVNMPIHFTVTLQ